MKLITRLLSLLTLLICTASCVDKVPNNGPLDDMWQLMTIEQDGTVTDTKERMVYWSIRANLLQLSGYALPNMFGHFRRSGNNLLIYDLCHASAHEKVDDNDEWITFDERDILLPWGITPIPDPNNAGRLCQEFYIEYLDKNRMILTTPKQRLTFRKF